jgi:hypothetical protein
MSKTHIHVGNPSWLCADDDCGHALATATRIHYRRCVALVATLGAMGVMALLFVAVEDWPSAVIGALLACGLFALFYEELCSDRDPSVFL